MKLPYPYNRPVYMFKGPSGDQQVKVAHIARVRHVTPKRKGHKADSQAARFGVAIPPANFVSQALAADAGTDAVVRAVVVSKVIL